MHFYLGEKLTYDRVLEVLGAVDTDVFSELLRLVLAEQITDAIALLDRLILDGRDLTQFVNDFTWYLRNLMLLKASDDMEDILEYLHRESRTAAQGSSDDPERYAYALY